MATRVTQQVVTVGFETNPKIRVSAIAVELIRSINSGSLSAGSQPVLITAVS